MPNPEDVNVRIHSSEADSSAYLSFEIVIIWSLLSNWVSSTLSSPVIALRILKYEYRSSEVTLTCLIIAIETTKSFLESLIPLTPVESLPLKILTSETANLIAFPLDEFNNTSSLSEHILTPTRLVFSGNFIAIFPIGKIFIIAFPLEFRPPIGSLQVFILYTIPSVEKNRSGVCVFATNKFVTTSSSFGFIPCKPLPPRFWALYSDREVLLMYPPAVTLTTISSFSIKSSSSVSPSKSIISDCLSFPYFSEMAVSSSFTISSIFSLDSKISKYDFIFFESWINSSVISLIPKAVNLCNLKSNIAFDWFSVKLYVPSSLILCDGSSIRSKYSTISCEGHLVFIRLFLASIPSLEFLIRFTILSILETATAKPHKRWLLSLFFLRSNSVLFVTISTRNSINSSKYILRFSCSGLPLLRANKLHPKLVWRGVNLYNWFKTTSAVASRFNSITIRIPNLSDSSCMCEIPSIFLFFAKSAIFSIKFDLFTWYGISETMIADLSCLMVSIFVFALINIEPFPSA